VNPGPLLFLGTFFMMAVSWLGFVLVPQLQIGRQPDTELPSNGQFYPSMRPGEARQGEQIYRANGCYYCHTEQVRPKGYGSDFERNWGGRPGVVQSVAADYLYDRPAMLGSQRVGPDLANYGLRETNEMSILLHLYNPQITMQGSVMPPYGYLFTKRKLNPGDRRSEQALPATGTIIASSEEVVPTDEAHALAAYLMSLRSDGILFETPAPAPPTNKPAGTNVTSATNAASTNDSSTNK
jgi:cytochrome c oxidase cbb3-type subunit II